MFNNNSVMKFVNWVVYSVIKISQVSGCLWNWVQDFDLLFLDMLVFLVYKNVYMLLKVDRGYQVLLVGLGGVLDWLLLNYLLNIMLQKFVLNQGVWVVLENWVCEFVKQVDVFVVYVVIGFFFEWYIVILLEDVMVEIFSGYWKVLFIGMVLLKSEGNYVVFIMDQNIFCLVNFCDYQVIVEVIEYKMKLVLMLWFNLFEVVVSEVKIIKGSLVQRLGC